MSSLEGLGIEIMSLKICPKTIRPVIKEDISGENWEVYLISLDRDGEGEIVIEHSPKRALFSTSSLLDKGTTISGQKLSGFSKNPINKNSIGTVGKGRSGGHTGQYATMSGVCYLNIVIAYGRKVVDKLSKDLFLPEPETDQISSEI